jgi:anti-sigma-K factor RskA
MTMATYSDEDTALAAELVLGLLDPAAEATARARCTRDPGFAAEVSAWEERLLPLAYGRDEPAPDSVWQHVDDHIKATPRQENRSTPLRFWQGVSALAATAALILGILMLNKPTAPPQSIPLAPTMVAALRSETGTSAMTASYDAGNGQLTVAPVRLETGALYPELWIIPEGGEARSLGIVVGDHPTRIAVAPNLRALMAKGATLAITSEPKTGAPGGKATGPVVVSGKLYVLS